MNMGNPLAEILRELSKLPKDLARNIIKACDKFIEDYIRRYSPDCKEIYWQYATCIALMFEAARDMMYKED